MAPKYRVFNPVGGELGVFEADRAGEAVRAALIAQGDEEFFTVISAGRDEFDVVTYATQDDCDREDATRETSRYILGATEIND